MHGRERYTDSMSRKQRRRRTAACALAALAALAASRSAEALDCRTLSEQIAAKLRAGGLERFTLATVDSATPSAGRVVGSCEQGTRKIVYLAAVVRGASSNAPARRVERQIITECRDGSTPADGRCKD